LSIQKAKNVEKNVEKMRKRNLTIKIEHNATFQILIVIKVVTKKLIVLIQALGTSLRGFILKSEAIQARDFRSEIGEV